MLWRKRRQKLCEAAISLPTRHIVSPLVEVIKMPRRPYSIIQSAYDRRSAARSIVATCASAVFGAVLFFPGLRPDFAATPPEISASGGQLVGASKNSQCYVDVRLDEMLFHNALLDTGASGYLTIGSNQAKRAGIDLSRLSFDHRYSSANGTGKFARVQISTVRIGKVLAMRNVAVDVTAAPQEQILVGIEILRLLNMRLRSASCELNFWS
jgi:clan AA aspartic protease (TIGR02281 family)